MRFPWRSSRRRRESEPEPYPDVAYEGFGKGVEVVPLARFVRARVEEERAVVDRYRRSRGRGPLTEGLENVLVNHERDTGVPLASAEARILVLHDHVEHRRDWIGRIEHRMRAEHRIDDTDFATMIVYAGHWSRHPGFDRSWTLINFMSGPGEGG